MASLVRTVAPTATPVSLDEAKMHLRASGDEQDNLIRGLIQAATDHFDGVSGVLGRALLTQTWKVSVARPRDALSLPLLPLQSIEAVTYWDTANAEQTWAGSNYLAYTDALGPYVYPLKGTSWPSLYDREDALSIEFVAGYGDAAAVPAPIKQAILLLVGHWWRNREAVSDAAAPLPLAVEMLTSPFKRWSI